MEMNQIVDFLKGKKTYIVSFLMILLGILQQDSELIMEGLAFAFIRAGVSKM